MRLQLRPLRVAIESNSAMQTPHIRQAIDRATKHDFEGRQACEGRKAPENAEIFKAGENLRISGK